MCSANVCQNILCGKSANYMHYMKALYYIFSVA